MTVITKRVVLSSEGEGEMINLTEDVTKSLGTTGIKNGIVTIFVAGSTGAVTTIEYESGLRKDFPAMLQRIVPNGIFYEHDERWRDGNGHSHVRSSLIGPSLTVPFCEGKLILGTWQQIVFVELDVRRRTRELILQIIGD